MLLLLYDLQFFYYYFFEFFIFQHFCFSSLELSFVFWFCVYSFIQHLLESTSLQSCKPLWYRCFSHSRAIRNHIAHLHTDEAMDAIETLKPQHSIQYFQPLYLHLFASVCLVSNSSRLRALISLELLKTTFLLREKTLVACKIICILCLQCDFNTIMQI